jgi:hypothetical protein
MSKAGSGGRGRENPRNAFVYLSIERNAASGTEASWAQLTGKEINSKATAKLSFVIALVFSASVRPGIGWLSPLVQWYR